MDDTTGNEVDANTMPVTAAQQAVPWINQIRGNGSPFIAIGFGDAATTGYLDAAVTGNSSGPGNVTLETSSVIKMDSAGSLAGVLSTLANQMCGNLSLNKIISPNYFPHVIPPNAPSVAVNDTIPITLTLTNNATTPVTGVVVQDEVPLFLNNLTPPVPAGGTTASYLPPAVGGRALLNWSISTIGARQQTTVTFTGKFIKTYTAPADETYVNYAQVTAATNYTAT